jgi:hypothetical protein
MGEALVFLSHLSTTQNAAVMNSVQAKRHRTQDPMLVLDRTKIRRSDVTNPQRKAITLDCCPRKRKQSKQPKLSKQSKLSQLSQQSNQSKQLKQLQQTKQRQQSK